LFLLVRVFIGRLFLVDVLFSAFDYETKKGATKRMPWPAPYEDSKAATPALAKLDFSAIQRMGTSLFKQLDELARQRLRDLLNTLKFSHDDQIGVLRVLDEPFDELAAMDFVTSRYYILFAAMDDVALLILLSSCCWNYSVMQLALYPNTTVDKTLPCHEHADAGVLTLCLLPEPGLQAYVIDDDKWVDCGTSTPTPLPPYTSSPLGPDPCMSYTHLHTIVSLIVWRLLPLPPPYLCMVWYSYSSVDN
jgi:hypothetical protein